jgi:hypothetical protein
MRSLCHRHEESGSWCCHDRQRVPASREEDRRNDVTTAIWGLALTILVSIAIVVAILLFERPRARRIEEDLRYKSPPKDENA